MIFNTRKIRQVEIEGVTFHFKTLDCYQQIEFTEMVPRLSDPKAIPEIVIWVFNNLIVKIEGLTDEENNDVIFSDIESTELVKGFNLSALRKIIDETIKLFNVSYDLKKN